MGHIKLFLESGSSLYKISLTTADEEPTFDFITSAGASTATSANLKILCAVTGFDSRDVQAVIETAVQTVLSEKKIEFVPLFKKVE